MFFKSRRFFTFLFLLLTFLLLVNVGCRDDESTQTSQEQRAEAFPCREELVDERDENAYQTVQIGDQCWMQENLRYLPEVIGSDEGSKEEPYYYVYDYEGTDMVEVKETRHYDTYGVLYNWVAAMDGDESSEEKPSGVQGVCPDGWHLPSDAQWTELEIYLAENGYNYDGSESDPSEIDHLKRSKIGKSLAATKLWEESSDYDRQEGAVGTDLSKNNSSGFTALPAGYRLEVGSFGFVELYDHWWGATEDDTDTAFIRELAYYSQGLTKSPRLKDFGYSVRCVSEL